MATPFSHSPFGSRFGKQECLTEDGMKRSRTVALVVMGLTPLFVSVCDDT
jgi:hypothetical protein